MKKVLFIITLAMPFCRQSNAQRINPDLVMRTISYLSSDELGGRGTSSKEELKAAAYIAEQFRNMGLPPKGTEGYYFDFTFRHNPNIHDTNTSSLPVRTGRNVLAFLNNQAAKTIVIGAHYDHLGYGMDGNSLDANPKGKIHNGADDNASGVAGVLELARYFSNNGITEHYNFLFMTFSGEELGLIGSKKWCETPTLPLESINYMINMDMIGRLNDSTKKLLVYGVGTSPSWTEALEKVNRTFSLKYDSAGVGPSDHTSFYLKNIPTLHFFTGQHSDYHKPTDDAFRINTNGEVEVLELIINLVQYLDNKPALAFLKTKNEESGKMSFKVTMGVMPDYTYDGKGLRLDAVTDGKPAANAGIQGGDILLKVGETEINNIQDYMKSLNTINKGEEIQVILMRKNEQIIKTVRF